MMQQRTKLFSILLLGLCLGCLAACNPSKNQDAREVANAFWTAVLKEDMEQVKTLVTWESTQYLSLLQSKKLSIRRFETGEMKIENGLAEVATVLYSGEKGDVPIPLRTILSLKDNKWLVEVQKTLGTMVSGAMGAVVDQLNSFMQEGLKGLDSQLSESLDKLGKSLEKNLEDLQKGLKIPPPQPNQGDPNRPPAQPI